VRGKMITVARCTTPPRSAPPKSRAPTDHGQLRVETAGIGTSRPAFVETPTAVS
jgi:hypothetical protein